MLSICCRLIIIILIYVWLTLTLAKVCSHSRLITEGVLENYMDNFVIPAKIKKELEERMV